ncbi:MAG: hypothetical protein DRH06_01155 [Deltaproteobacteria bacterium]|nr:MAG: hypothetical protein DRH06_01155 [Deltaproteobacteria bacterium]
MQEVKKLGVMETGYFDKKTGKPVRRACSLFECPECKKQYRIRTDVGKKRKTCKECRGSIFITHGMAGTKVYMVYQALKNRCNNKNNLEYHRYGGRGITYPVEWETFEGFWKDMEAGYAEGLTIDREDGDGNYCKENCQWISHSENSSKTCRSRPVTQYRQVLRPEKKLEKMKEWPTAKAAADALGLEANHITVVCQGKRKTHGGFAWKYTQSPDTHKGKEKKNV